MNLSKGNRIMEYTYIDIEAYVRRAQQQRSDALGEILSAGWKSFKQACVSLKQNLLHPGTRSVDTSATLA
jgi:hypothetical protein